MAEEKLNWNTLKKRSIDGIGGLVLAITQDYKTGEVLMTAFMNQEAFEKTLETGKVHYYSTSRNKIWLKGESSGNFQKVKELFVDCDMDALLLKIEQKGGACHEGYRSCFYRKNSKGVLKTIGEKLFNPNEVYKK
ncbi:MAG: phosphoribosyl-AMP cyclohydrolase [Candidatus Altiarchaeales archaeon]|nr:phosphoribosyl-AMP cyclohydrolase [Candidatus Altiarchaeales archaeon]